MEEMERIGNQGVTLNRCRLGGQRKGVLTTEFGKIAREKDMQEYSGIFTNKKRASHSQSG